MNLLLVIGFRRRAVRHQSERAAQAWAAPGAGSWPPPKTDPAGA